MRESIFLHFGEAGIQIGQSCWEMFCLEHGINKDGTVPVSIDSDSSPKQNYHTLFEETSRGNYVPRSLFVDLDPFTIDQIKTRDFKHLFHPNNLISHPDSGANNYIRCYYSLGREIRDKLENQFRKLVERCDRLNNIYFTHSLEGGTGSGFVGLIQHLLNVYVKQTKINFTLFPSPRYSTNIVGIYNAVLSSNDLSEHSDLIVVMDNEAISRISENTLDVYSPKYSNLNQIIAQVISRFTSPDRYHATTGSSSHFLTNLVPYPRIHYITPSIGGFTGSENYFCQQHTVSQITDSLFEPSSSLMKFSGRNGKLMGSLVLYQGDVTPSNIAHSINVMKIKKKLNFVDWLPIAFKCSINLSSPIFAPNWDFGNTSRNACMFSNSSDFSLLIDKLNKDFDRMYKKRACVHWFLGEGGESGCFFEARENLSALEKDYEEVIAPTVDLDESSQDL